jgi:hypothetical protein
MLTGRNAGNEAPGRGEKADESLCGSVLGERTGNGFTLCRGKVTQASRQHHQLSRKRAELAVITFPNREHGSHAGKVMLSLSKTKL